MKLGSIINAYPLPVLKSIMFGIVLSATLLCVIISWKLKIISCQVQLCPEENSCKDVEISGPWSYRCTGYRSCDSVTLTLFPFVDSRSISCEASYSCFGASKLSKAVPIYCHGLFSCARVSDLYTFNASVSCGGEKSCLNSKITMEKNNSMTPATHPLYCDGLQSCMDATIETQSDIYFRGLLSGQHSTIQFKSNNITIYFYGSQSGYHSTIICDDGYLCTVECYGDACDDTTTFNTNDGTFDIIYNIDHEEGEADQQLSISSFMYQWPSLADLSFTLEENINTANTTHYNPCNTTLTGAIHDTDAYNDHDQPQTNKAPICCSGLDGCDGVNTITNMTNEQLNNDSYIDRTAIRCDGWSSCGAFKREAANSGGDVYFSGSDSGTSSTATTTNEYDIICSGNASCYQTTITTANNVYCGGMASCQDGSLRDIGGNVYFYGSTSGSYTDIDGVHGSVYCASGYQSCYNSEMKNINDDLYGVGYQSLFASDITNIGDSVLGFGYQTLAQTTIVNVGSLYCDGDYCFQNGHIETVYNITVNGSNALVDSVMISQLSGADFILKIYGDNNESFSLTCTGSDDCYIGCYSENACTNMELYCTGDCFIDCGGNYNYNCPIVASGTYTKWHTDPPTTIPTTIPTNQPTVIPTGPPTSPSDSPTNQPTIIPTRDPTNPSRSPTDLPTSIPTNNPTQNPTNKPVSDTSTVPTTVPTQSPEESSSGTSLSVSNNVVILGIVLSVVFFCLVCGCWIATYILLKERSKSKLREAEILRSNKNGIGSTGSGNIGDNFNAASDLKLKRINLQMTNIGSVTGETENSQNNGYENSSNIGNTGVYQYRKNNDNIGHFGSSDNLVDDHGEDSHSNSVSKLFGSMDDTNTIGKMESMDIRMASQDRDINNNNMNINNHDDNNKLELFDLQSDVGDEKQDHIDIIADGEGDIVTGAGLGGGEYNLFDNDHDNNNSSNNNNYQIAKLHTRSITELASGDERGTAKHVYVTPGCENGGISIDESKYQQWSKKDVLIWLKENLINNGFSQKQAKRFLKEFSKQSITGGTLHMLKYKDNDEVMFNQLRREFSIENQAFGLWMTVKTCIKDLHDEETDL